MNYSLTSFNLRICNLKLGIVAPFLDNRPRGIGRVSYFLLREFSLFDGDYEILSPVIPEGANKEKFKKISLNLAPSLGTRANIRRFFWQNFLLKGYTYICSTSYESSLLYGEKQVIFVYDLINLKFKDFKTPLLVRYYYRFQMPIILGKGAKVFVDSNAVKKDMMEFYELSEDRIGVVYLGIDTNIYKPIYDESVLHKLGLARGEYILYVGDIIKRKNIGLIIKALTKVKDKVFIAAGTAFAKVKNELLTLANELKVLDRVKFLGYVDDKTLRVLYSNCFAFVYPSLMEGFGLPPLEAAACGAPVIVSDIEVFKELYKGYFIFVDPHDTDDLIEKLNRLEDDDFRRNLITKYPSLFKRFSWKSSAKTFFNYLYSWGFL